MKHIIYIAIITILLTNSVLSKRSILKSTDDDQLITIKEGNKGTLAFTNHNILIVDYAFARPSYAKQKTKEIKEFFKYYFNEEEEKYYPFMNIQVATSQSVKQLQKDPWKYHLVFSSVKNNSFNIQDGECSILYKVNPKIKGKKNPIFVKEFKEGSLDKNINKNKIIEKLSNCIKNSFNSKNNKMFYISNNENKEEETLRLNKLMYTALIKMKSKNRKEITFNLDHGITNISIDDLSKKLHYKRTEDQFYGVILVDYNYINSLGKKKQKSLKAELNKNRCVFFYNADSSESPKLHRIYNEFNTKGEKIETDLHEITIDQINSCLNSNKLNVLPIDIRDSQFKLSLFPGKKISYVIAKENGMKKDIDVIVKDQNRFYSKTRNFVYSTDLAVMDKNNDKYTLNNDILKKKNKLVTAIFVDEEYYNNLKDLDVEKYLKERENDNQKQLEVVLKLQEILKDIMNENTNDYCVIKVPEDYDVIELRNEYYECLNN